MIYTYSMQKDLAEVKALLSTVPLLSALGEEELQSLAGEFSTLALKAGQSLYSVGEPTDGLYLLARGKMQCLQAGEPPKAAILTAGEWVGEESLQGEPQRQSSASERGMVQQGRPGYFGHCGTSYRLARSQSRARWPARSRRGSVGAASSPAACG